MLLVASFAESNLSAKLCFCGMNSASSTGIVGACIRGAALSGSSTASSIGTSGLHFAFGEKPFKLPVVCSQKDVKMDIFNRF